MSPFHGGIAEERTKGRHPAGDESHNFLPLLSSKRSEKLRVNSQLLNAASFFIIFLSTKDFQVLRISLNTFFSPLKEQNRLYLFNIFIYRIVVLTVLKSQTDQSRRRINVQWAKCSYCICEALKQKNKCVE